MQTCRNGKASAIPSADDRQAKLKGQDSLQTVFDKFNKQCELMLDRHLNPDTSLLQDLV